jgi:hypothetical protein
MEFETVPAGAVFLCLVLAGAEGGAGALQVRHGGNAGLGGELPHPEVYLGGTTRNDARSEMTDAEP